MLFWRLNSEFRNNYPEEHAPYSGTLLHFQHSQGENLIDLPAPADRATHRVEVFHFTCERDQERKGDCMERLVEFILETKYPTSNLYWKTIYPSQTI